LTLPWGRNLLLDKRAGILEKPPSAIAIFATKYRLSATVKATDEKIPSDCRQ
jgi:hypothetical protein